MVPEKDLFNLIKSLDSNEKRYFKQHLSLQTGGKNYAALFRAISVQKEYDEPELRRQLKKQIRDFASTKRNLFLLVLRSLRLYHARSSAEIRQYEMMQNAEVLFRKGLYQECRKMIKKAKQEAAVYNNTLMQLVAMNEEAKVIRRLDFENLDKNHFDKLLDKHRSLVETYQTEFKVKNINDRFMRMHMKAGASQSTFIKKRLRGIIDFPLLEKKKLPVGAEIFARITLMTYYLNIKNYERSNQHSGRLLKRLTEMPRLSNEHQGHYVNVQIFMAISLLKTKGYKECFAIIEKLKSMPVTNKKTASTIFYFAYVMEFNFLNTSGQFEKAVSLVEEVKAGLKKYRNYINNNHYLALCYSMAYSFFGNRNYSGAIEWIKKILNDVKTDLRVDFYTTAYLLWIMSHIEKGNYDSALYLSRSKPEYRGKNQSLFKIENIFLDFVIKRLSKTNTSKEARDAFKELKVQIEKLLQSPFERQILAYIDLPAWIESKIENRSYQEIMMERAKEQISLNKN